MDRIHNLLTETETGTETVDTMILHLKPVAKSVQFTEDTVDNEEMNKKSSNSKN